MTSQETMFISDFAIKRPLVTVVAMVSLVIFGIFALMKLKTDEFPDVAPPWLTVAVIYPGASPEGVEKEVLDPIEEQVASIAGVKRIMSKAYDGYALLMVEFLFDKDLNEASQDVRDAISTVRIDLPAEMEEPIIRKFNDTDRPIISVALSSVSLSPAELTRLADPGITRELRSVAGVSDVQVFGKVERELTVEVRPDRLQAASVSIGQVVQAIMMQNLAAPVGAITGALEETSSRLKGRMENVSEFANLVVTDRGGRLVRLGDVADVKDATEEPRTLALYDHQEAVGIDIKKMKGYSTTDVAARLRGRIEAMQQTLPPGTKMDIIKDSGERVESAVANVEESLLLGALLTVLVVFVFLNSWRSTVITGVALPISVLASFIAVWALGFRLETMSLLGLSLAIGILIDDAIVVRENIVRHVEMGKDHYTAAREGTAEIGLAVAATTFSILAVFVPIGFMTGISGQWFKPFALTIASSVAVSLFVSFSLDPMLSAYWPDPHLEEHQKGWVTKKLDRFNNWFNRQAENYKKLVGWALDHRTAMVAIATLTFFASFVLPMSGFSGLAVAVAGIAIIVFGLTRKGRMPVKALLVAGGFVVFFGAFSPKLPPIGKVGTAFFPEDDRSEFIIKLETPPGSSLDYTRLKAEEAIRILKSHPEVRYTYATLGEGASGAVDNGNIYVRTVPKSERDVSVSELARTLRKQFAKVAGATVTIFESDFGGGFKQIQVQVRGPELASLNETALKLRDTITTIPGAVDIGLSSKGLKPEVSIELKRGVAGAMGVTAGQVAQSLRPAFAGIDAGDWVDPTGETRDVRVRLAPEARRRAADLAQIPLVVIGANGAPTTVPLGQIAEITEGTGPAIIDHLNRQAVVTVELNTSGRAAGDVSADIQEIVDGLRLPPGVSITLGGDTESQAEVFGAIFGALGLAILLMYLILVVQFGSFVDPLAIMMSLPLSLIGVILLMGLVAKNAILLIDFAKWAREDKGMPLREALIEAGAIRLRPILMTTFALIAGMLPVALGRGDGAQFRSPLGIAVIGGVITSTFLTLLVIPTGYEILDEIRHWFMGKLGRTPKQMTAEHRAPIGAAVEGAN
jgi:HAE1 family hydrophobic/amphiphilic exporter-1